MKIYIYTSILLIVIAGCISPLTETDEEQAMVTFSTDLEQPDSAGTAEPVSWQNLETVAEGKAFSGNRASRLNQEVEFSVVFEQKFGYIAESNPNQLTFKAMVYSDEPFPTAFVVASIAEADYYRNYPLAEFLPTADKWEQVNATFTLPDSLKPSDKLKVYVWNRKKSNVWVDDLSLEFEFNPSKN